MTISGIGEAVGIERQHGGVMQRDYRAGEPRGEGGVATATRCTNGRGTTLPCARSAKTNVSRTCSVAADDTLAGVLELEKYGGAENDYES